MSEAAAKATRRDLRRAFGLDGLAVINRHGDTLQQHVLPSLLQVANQLAAQSARLAALESWCAQHDRPPTAWARLCGWVRR